MKLYSIEDRKKEILRSYKEKHDKAKVDAEERKEKLYLKYPRLQYIEDEINRIGLSSLKNVLFKGMSKEEAKELCEEEISVLVKDKLEIYKENNIPLDYTEPKFECSMCNDTGMLENGEKCVCYRQQLLDDVYKLSNMNVLLQTQNFNNFDINVFSSVPNKEGKIQKELMEENIQIAKNFIKNIGDKEEKSLLLYGPTGSGKTFLSSCIAKEVLDKGYTVVYTTMSELVNLAKEHTFGEMNNEVNSKYKLMNVCDLLIIDDLGTELINTFVKSEVYTIINNKLINGKKVIISTNLSPQQIYSQYSGRVFYRLVEGYKMLEFIGPNLRITKLD